MLVSSLALLAGSCDSSSNRIQTVDGNVSIFQPRSASHSLGLRGTKTVALTFDDGPNITATPEILDYLREEGIKATFFLIGNNVDAHPSLVQRIADDGHTLGNHSNSHPNMPTLGKQNINRVYREIADADRKISPFMRPTNRYYFRPPEGAWAEFESSAMNRHPDLVKYIAPVKWDVGGANIYADEYGRPVNRVTNNLIAAADWECWSRKIAPGVCAAGYFNAIQQIQGGIVLMHDRGPNEIVMVKVLVRALKEQGYRFVSLDEIPQMEQFK